MKLGQSRLPCALLAFVLLAASSYAQGETGHIAGARSAQYIVLKTHEKLKKGKVEETFVRLSLDGNSVAFKLFCNNDAQIILVTMKMSDRIKEDCNKKGVVNIIEAEIDGGEQKLIKYVNGAKTHLPVVDRWNKALQ